MAPDTGYIAGGLVTRFAAVPARIALAVAGWSTERLRISPGAGAWSASDILAHVRASDDIVAPRIYMTLARDNPPLLAFDERRWAEIADYHVADFQASLAAFTVRRSEMARVLGRLTPAEWQRAGTHEARGSLTLAAIVESLVAHEEEHCAQLEALTAR